MKALPWILVLILLAATGFLFNSHQKDDAESARLRQENIEISQSNIALEAAKKAEAENVTVPLPDKEKQELIRLRNEVGQLKREKLQLTTQVQKAQSDSEKLLQSQQAQQEKQVQQLQQQNQQLAQQTEVTKAKNACINNLRQIDGAKQQWALENKQAAEAVPTAQDLAPFFRGQTVPVCPSSGTYTFGNMETDPTCSMAGHVLPQ